MTPENVAAKNHPFSAFLSTTKSRNFVRKDNLIHFSKICPKDDNDFKKAKFCPENGNDPQNAWQRTLGAAI